MVSLMVSIAMISFWWCSLKLLLCSFCSITLLDVPLLYVCCHKIWYNLLACIWDACLWCSFGMNMLVFCVEIKNMMRRDVPWKERCWPFTSCKVLGIISLLLSILCNCFLSSTYWKVQSMKILPVNSSIISLLVFYQNNSITLSRFYSLMMREVCWCVCVTNLSFYLVIDWYICYFAA